MFDVINWPIIVQYQSLYVATDNITWWSQKKKKKKLKINIITSIIIYNRVHKYK